MVKILQNQGNFFDTEGHHLFCMWVFRCIGIAFQLLSCTNEKKRCMQPCDLSDRVSVKSLSFMAILRGHANNVVRIQDKTTETKYKGNV